LAAPSLPRRAFHRRLVRLRGDGGGRGRRDLGHHQLVVYRGARSFRADLQLSADGRSLPGGRASLRPRPAQPPAAALTAMRSDQQRYRTFARRTALLAGGKALLLSTLVGRMYYLQVVESEKYAVLADENRINLRLLPPPRGRIYDRFGVPIAVNDQNYRVVIIAEQTPDLEATLSDLSQIIP